MKLIVVDRKRNPIMTFNANTDTDSNPGSVGIGTIYPQGKMEIQYDQNKFTKGKDTNSLDGTLILTNNDVKTVGTIGANIKFAQRWSNTNGTTTNQMPLEMGAITGYNETNNTFGGGLTFWTHPPADDDMVERMRINHNGNVGIGTTSPQHKLDVDGGFQVSGSAYFSSDLTCKNKINAKEFTTTSDRSLKKNIEPLQNSLEKVVNLQGVSYNLINDDNVNDSDDDNYENKKIGFIAQDVEKILPEVVYTNKIDDLKSISYQNIIPLLVESIKDLKNEIDMLKKQISK